MLALAAAYGPQTVADALASLTSRNRNLEQIARTGKGITADKSLRWNRSGRHR